MAERRWRCSECGTINEPDATSCSNCGKWPSLFDLEDDAIDDDVDFEPLLEREQVATYEAPEPEPRTVDVEAFEAPEPVSAPQQAEAAPVEPKPEGDEDAETRGPRWVRWLVPIVFVAYLVFSYIFQNR